MLEFGKGWIKTFVINMGGLRLQWVKVSKRPIIMVSKIMDNAYKMYYTVSPDIFIISQKYLNKHLFLWLWKIWLVKINNCYQNYNMTSE